MFELVVNTKIQSKEVRSQSGKGGGGAPLKTLCGTVVVFILCPNGTKIGNSILELD